MDMEDRFMRPSARRPASPGPPRTTYLQIQRGNGFSLEYPTLQLLATARNLSTFWRRRGGRSQAHGDSAAVMEGGRQLSGTRRVESAAGRNLNELQCAHIPLRPGHRAALRSDPCTASTA